MDNMSEEKMEQERFGGEETVETAAEHTEVISEVVEEPKEEVQSAKLTPEETLATAIREQEDKYLRLLADFDNFRKRSQRERETAWTTAKAETAAAFLPVFDNLARALKQETADEAYAKGVQMTMTQLKGILDKLGIEEILAEGQSFDPALHNAVMHVEDEALGENIVAEVFEPGFMADGKVIRFAMVKVAN